jgi:hypothetical protein
MRITIHIERLVLDGVPVAAHQLGVLQQALETQLAALLSPSAGGSPWGPVAPGGGQRVLRTQAALGPGADAGAWGEGIAAAVGGAIMPVVRGGEAKGS